MSTTTAVERDHYEVKTLTERIAANEEIHGPGCRPELRERLAAAKRRIARREAEAQHRVEANLLSSREVSYVRLSNSPSAKLHVVGDFGAECGAYDRSDWASDGTPAGWGNAYDAVRRTDVCGRCKASLIAWTKND